MPGKPNLVIWEGPERAGARNGLCSLEKLIADGWTALGLRVGLVGGWRRYLKQKCTLSGPISNLFLLIVLLLG